MKPEIESLPENEWPPTLAITMKLAERAFEEHKEIVPCVIANVSGQLLVCMIPEGLTQESKDKVEELMVRFVRQGAEEVEFLSEAWAVSADLKSGSDVEQAVRLSRQGRINEHPDRVEVVNICYESSRHVIQAVRRITREPDARLAEGWDVHADLGFVGRFTNLFHKARFVSREMS